MTPHRPRRGSRPSKARSRSPSPGASPATTSTGRPSWPLILIEGGEKTGKTWACAQLSASDKISQTYWIDLGEGSGDEYGAIPGSNYLLVEHDGSYNQLFDAVATLHREGQHALDGGENPIALVIDSMGAEWDLLKAWAANRAKGSKKNRERLATDPHAEIDITMNYWNDANSRHRKLMHLLMTFPGIVMVTARGKWVSVLGLNGQPLNGQKEYTLEAQKQLGFDASLWIRLARDSAPVVVGARSIHSGIRPGIDEPKRLPANWSLEWLIFEVLKFDTATAQVRDLVEPKPCNRRRPNCRTPPGRCVLPGGACP